MDLGAILDNSQMPGFEFARDDVKAQARQSIDLGKGSAFFSGHDAGVSFRFFVEAVPNEMMTKKLKYFKPDPVEMIQWFIDVKNKPCAVIKELPEELLSFDTDTNECIGGKYAEEYRRFKAGMTAPGMSLSGWGELDVCDLQTLVNAGIFSVEQLAAQSDEKMNRYHESIREAFQKAIFYVNGKQNRVQAEAIAAELLKSEQARAKLEEKHDALQAQIDELMAAAPAAVISKRSKGEARA